MCANLPESLPGTRILDLLAAPHCRISPFAGYWAWLAMGQSNGWGSLPLIVVEEDERLFDQAVAELQAAGWRVVRTWDPQAERSRTQMACAGRVAGPEDAERALLAALRGFGLVVSVRRADDGAAVFLEDLRRLGPLDIRSSGSEAVRLNPGETRLLGLLAEGTSLSTASRELHLSRRSAYRRLARVRKALGVATVAEAVREARIRGLC
jgi:DNA-binding CsgD family transcriptional regulator